MILFTERKYEIRETQLMLSNIPNRFWYFQTKAWNDKSFRGKLEDLLSVSKWIPNGESILMMGPPNSGKTAFTTMVCKSVIQHGGTCLFAPCWDLFSWKMSEFQDRLYHDDLLILDGFLLEEGLARKDKLNQRVQYEYFFRDILKRRYEKNLSTIVTTVDSKKKIAESVDQITLAVFKKVFNKQLIFQQVFIEEWQ